MEKLPRQGCLVSWRDLDCVGINLTVRLFWWSTWSTYLFMYLYFWRSFRLWVHWAPSRFRTLSEFLVLQWQRTQERLNLILGLAFSLHFPFNFVTPAAFHFTRPNFEFHSLKLPWAFLFCALVDDWTLWVLCCGVVENDAVVYFAWQWRVATGRQRALAQMVQPLMAQMRWDKVQAMLVPQTSFSPSHHSHTLTHTGISSSCFLWPTILYWTTFLLCFNSLTHVDPHWHQLVLFSLTHHLVLDYTFL